MCSNAYGAGAISVSNGSYLYMSGGTITDNTCMEMSGCGGIAVRDGGTVEMCGGSVTGNHTNFEQDNSSIRIVGEDSTFKISGSAYADIILLDTNLDGCNIIVAGNLTTADTIGVSVSPLVGSEEAEKGYVILGASEYNADNYSKFKLIETWSFFKIVYDEELKTAVMAVDESQFKTAKVSSSEVFSYKTAGNIGGNVQSACTDGTYVYIAIEQAVKDGSSYISGTCYILKIDPSSWSVLGVYGPYDTNHSNDMTYNPETRELIITNNSDNATTDDVDESHVVTCISTETFEVTRTIEINFTGITNGMYSLSYSSAYDKYVVGIKGSYNIAFTDENFEDFEYIIGMSGFTRQNNYLSDEYIYSVRTSVNTNRNNYIVVYDWDGNYIEAFCISNTNYEIESIFELNGKLYAVFIPSSTYTGVVIYELSGIIDTLEDSSDSSGSASGILGFFQRIIAFFRRIFEFLGLM
ncbi:MAG: hypothetical protein LUH40_03705 [Clostridiales bacterium]|nr:hypothetical protein [Clostridiales bacterium]